MQTQGNKTSPRKLEQIGYYTLTGNLLGKGNFARVEEAHHSILNVKVAIKIIDTTKIKDEEYVTRNLGREARILSSLAHPSIMYLYEAFQHGPMYYLVAEVLLGGNLCSFMKRQRGGRLDEFRTRQYARQLISALAYMHSLGFIHRDLKMENVMLDSKWRHVKIVDFGLSSAWTAGQLLSTHCGSPEYAAPELFDANSRYGAEVDLWSLGVVLYGMAAGCLPFALSKGDIQVTSSVDRRIRLLTQVNQGYQRTHDKVLAHMSTDFRLVVSQLLTVNVKERITVSELHFHPWVTSRQKSMMTHYCYQLLNSEEKKKIIGHISKLLCVERDLVKNDIELNRLGQASGMYNLLVHRKRIDYFNMVDANSEDPKTHRRPKAKFTLETSDQPKKPMPSITDDQIIFKTFYCQPKEPVPKKIPNFQKPTLSSSKAADSTVAASKNLPPKTKPLICTRPTSSSRQTNKLVATVYSTASTGPIGRLASHGIAAPSKNAPPNTELKNEHKRTHAVPVPELKSTKIANKKTLTIADVFRTVYPSSSMTRPSTDVTKAPPVCIDKKFSLGAKKETDKNYARMKQMDLVNRLSQPTQNSLSRSIKPKKLYADSGHKESIGRKKQTKPVHIHPQNTSVPRAEVCHLENQLNAPVETTRRQISSSCRRYSENPDGTVNLRITRYHDVVRQEQVSAFETPVKAKTSSFHNNWEFTGNSLDHRNVLPPSSVSFNCKPDTLTGTQRHWENKVADANKKLSAIETDFQIQKPSSIDKRAACRKVQSSSGKNRVSWPDEYLSNNAHYSPMGNYTCDGRPSGPNHHERVVADANRSKMLMRDKIGPQNMYTVNETRSKHGSFKERIGSKRCTDLPNTLREQNYEKYAVATKDRQHVVASRGEHLSPSQEYILWSRLAQR